MELICRAHQVVEDGYELMFDRKVVTVFSAPNYCGEFDNAGAMMILDENLKISFKVLRPSSHKAKFPDLFPDYVPGQSSDSIDYSHSGDRRDKGSLKDHMPTAEELRLSGTELDTEISTDTDESSVLYG